MPSSWHFVIRLSAKGSLTGIRCVTSGHSAGKQEKNPTADHLRHNPVHSATKYVGGHGSAIAGVIVDSGNFDFGADPERFPGFNTPDPTYNGLVYARDLGAGGALGANLSYILKARVELLRDLGSAVSPFNAFLIAQGLETLSLRVERHVANAVDVAEWLEARDDVESVAYAGLLSSPWYERGRKYGPKGTGAVVAFNLAGGAEAGKRFVDALELHSHVANIGASAHW